MAFGVRVFHSWAGWGWVFLERARIPVESSLQRISSIFLFGNETIRRYLCKRDLDAANLRRGDGQ